MISRSTSQAGFRTRDLAVREAEPADMPAIRAIYAHEVLNGVATFEEEPPTADELLARRLRVRAEGLPYLVADHDGQVAGFSYATSYRARSAYRWTIEESVYVSPGARNRGVGRRLLTTLVDRCHAGPWRQMIAVVSDTGNPSSIVLHERLGFGRIGTLHAVGFKDGRWVDTVIMQRPIGCGADAPPVRDRQAGSDP